jgi:hypothetical protein
MIIPFSSLALLHFVIFSVSISSDEPLEELESDPIDPYFGFGFDFRILVYELIGDGLFAE